MKTSKKLLSAVTVIVACLTIMVVCGFSLEASACSCINGIRYHSEKGIAWVDGLCVEHKSTSIIIPETVTLPDYDNGGYINYRVEGISFGAFMQERNIVKVVLPNSIKEIGYRAFRECEKLKEINLPEGITTIGYSCFDGCDSLENIYLPETITHIGHSVFYNTNSLKNMTIAITDFAQIDPEALFSTGVENIILTETVVNLASNLQVTDGDLLGGVLDSPNIKNVTVYEDNPYYISEDGVLFNKDKTELIYYPTKKTDRSYSIPDSVERICSEAFRGHTYLFDGNYVEVYNENLEYIELPDNLKFIEQKAFYKCKNLKNISVIPNSIKEIYSQAFYTHSLTDVYYDGTEEEWNNIIISDGWNTSPFSPRVTMHFNDEIPPVDPPAPEPEDPEDPNMPITPIEPEEPKPEDHEHDYDDDKDEECNTCGYDRTENCDCRCHNDSFFAKIFWKITNFFNKLFKKNAICDCGIAHY